MKCERRINQLYPYERGGNKEKIWVPDIWTQLNDPFVSSRSSVDRAPAQCPGGHGFDVCRGLRNFYVPATLVIHCSFAFLSWGGFDN